MKYRRFQFLDTTGLAALKCQRTPAVRPQNCRERLGGLLRYDHREREIYDFSFWTLRRDLLLS